MNPNVLLVYKNFASHYVSHVGLGVSSLNTAKVLLNHGIQANVSPANTVADVAALLIADPTITHCVIAAPWITADDLTANLLRRFPLIQFVVNVHSNTGFLQADTNGVKLIRDYIDLEQGSLNFKVSANSEKGTRWLRTAFQCPAAYLPNLYYLNYSTITSRPLWNGGTLYIGAFGAQRLHKNLMTAAGAALEIANILKADTKFYVNSGRPDGGNIGPVIAMLQGQPTVELVQVPWQSWPKFRDIVRQMHLLISVSYTESFNMVTADGIAEGVPSVTSDAIDWVPDYWQAASDEASEIARIGRQLISDPVAARDGFLSLEQHNKDGFGAWCQWLNTLVQYKSLLSDPYLL